MSETAPDTLNEADTDAQVEAQGTCEKPVSPNCETTAFYTVILNLPDGAITIPCCEPCKDEHIKRANAEGVPVTVSRWHSYRSRPDAPAVAAESQGPHRLVERTAAAVAGSRDCRASAAPRRGSDFFEVGFQLKKGSDTSRLLSQVTSTLPARW